MSIKQALQKLKQSDLCAIFSVVDRTIMRWCDEGLPRHGEGRGHYYIWAEVLPWYLDRVVGAKGSGGPLSDKERKLKAEADLAEMEAAQEAGQLVDAAEAQKAWGDFLARVKVGLDGLPDRAAERLEDGMNLAEKAAVIRREVNATRRDLVAEAQKGREAA